jgi:hypothetical protein
VLAYLPGPTPVGAWIAIGLLASVDVVLAGTGPMRTEYAPTRGPD